MRGRAVRVLLFICGVVAGLILGMLTLWLVPLQLVTAVGLAVVALNVARPQWLPSLLWGGAVGAALPFVMVVALPLA
jgi:hypothetical protein